MKIIKGIEKIRKGLIERFREHSFIYSMIIFLEIYFCVFIPEIYLTKTLILRIIFYMLFLFLQNIMYKLMYKLMYKFIFYSMFILYFITLISYNVSLEIAVYSQGILIMILLNIFLICRTVEDVKKIGVIKFGFALIILMFLMFFGDDSWDAILLLTSTFIFLLENLEKRNKTIKFLNAHVRMEFLKGKIIKEIDHNKCVYNFILLRVNLLLLFTYISNEVTKKLEFQFLNIFFNNSKILLSMKEVLLKIFIISIFVFMTAIIESILFRKIEFLD